MLYCIVQSLFSRVYVKLHRQNYIVTPKMVSDVMLYGDKIGI